MHGSAEKATEVFIIELPFTSNHGGQILIGPADGYLYIMMGDGEAKAIPIISLKIRNLYLEK